MTLSSGTAAGTDAAAVGPPADLPSATRPPAPPAGGHLAAVDVVRFLTIAGVLLVHSTSLANTRSSLAANAVLEVTHVTRSVFLMLSAFVLTYSFRRKPLGRVPFWKRRYPLVVAPYVLWSLIYYVTDGDLHPSASSIGTFFLDLLDGGAKFHLYFLLLTMQLYLIFPLLMAAVRRWPRLLPRAVVLGTAFQVLFTAAVHYNWRPPVLGIWLDHPGTWLPSYLMYVVGGIAAAVYFDQTTAWIRDHYRLLAVAFVAALALSIGSYLADLSFLGYAPIKAAEVFQPANVIEAVAVTAAEFGLGLWVADRASVRRLAFLEKASDVSFGLYLAHPLLLEATLDVAAWAGISAVLATWPSGAVEAVIAFGLVPFVYVGTFVAVDVLRRSRLSLWLTGRRGPRPVPTPAPAPA
ncbi:MAG TPA: acyltransferase [Acidimicrobiales bacterium]|nr:acyltransferase [Acidimicrobiales bacterium]